MPGEQVVWVASAVEAIPLLRGLIEQNDAVLVKASRSVGLEAVVSALAQPSK
jgi:UDP-N-acetylmuramyl pentapeptide synthase